MLIRKYSKYLAKTNVLLKINICTPGNINTQLEYMGLMMHMKFLKGGV